MRLDGLPVSFAIKETLRRLPPRGGPAWAQFERVLRAAAALAPVFLVGRIGARDADGAMLDRFKPPFETTFYECQVAEGRTIVLLVVQVPTWKEVMVAGWDAADDGTILEYPVVCWVDPARRGSTWMRYLDQDVPEVDCRAFALTLGNLAVAAVDRGNRCAAETRTVPASRRNIGPSRASAGRHGWEYRIVEVPRPRGDDRHDGLGGTHASPRWHVRRGHWRVVAGGRKVWVRPCGVGDPEAGAVTHDYLVVEGQRPAGSPPPPP